MYGLNTQIEHNWECLSKKSKNTITKTLNNFFDTKYSKMHTSLVFENINKIIKKSDKFALNQEELSRKYLIYKYISKVWNDYIKENIYNPYIKENISSISVKKPVLWWKWYVVDLSWLSDNEVLVNYEDGHINSQIKLKVYYENNQVKTQIIE